MIRKLNLNDDFEARQFLNLQRVSYKIEAELIGYADLPPLKDTLATLQNLTEQFYGYFEGESLAGAIAYEKVGNVFDICRLVVRPEFFRRGIAGKLLQKIEGIEDAEVITVSTGSKNTPALELYKRYGFLAQEEQEVASGVFITCFKKVRSESKNV